MPIENTILKNHN